jgi:nanoRNase/pAp phosphatase (c-di-AMP/oligoRNAs hydrolase)
MTINQKEEIGKIIAGAENICLIAEDSDLESISSAMALFYTLKELSKNVNLIIEKFPQNLNFLAPSVDFISYPKNFTISIPKKIADIYQIYYEKNDDSLKIHLTVENGTVKKDDISFYFSEAKPDLIITLKIKNYQELLETKLNSFGFLLDSPVLNIDSENSSQNNKNFGRINLINKVSLTEIVLELITVIKGEIINKESADCLLAGLMIYTDNFNGDKITADIFESAALLMKSGADIKKINENLKI